MGVGEQIEFRSIAQVGVQAVGLDREEQARPAAVGRMSFSRSSVLADASTATEIVPRAAAGREAMR